jgi:hypothetical protein
VARDCIVEHVRRQRGKRLEEPTEHDQPRIQHVDRIAERDPEVLRLAFDGFGHRTGVGGIRLGLADLRLEAADPPAVTDADAAHVGMAELPGVAGHSVEELAGNHHSGTDAARTTVDVDHVLGVDVSPEYVFGDGTEVGVVGCEHRELSCRAEQLADGRVVPTQIGRQPDHGARRVHQPGSGDADCGDATAGPELPSHLLDGLGGQHHRLLDGGDAGGGASRHLEYRSTKADQTDGHGIDFGVHRDGQPAAQWPHDRAGAADLGGRRRLRLLDQAVLDQLLDQVLDRRP